MEQAGRVIAGLYQLEAQLGRGAMGRIWRAKHLRLESKLAIKFLDPSVSDHPEAFDRFVREAQSAAAVRSAHVVQIFDCGVDAGVPYISMELLEGESLDKRLSERGALSAAELCQIFGGVAQGVDTAHEFGVIHRDLKPGNIFITRERDVEIAKVLDFGIAKLMNRAADAGGAAGTGTGVMLGTPYYMSPEQVRGSRSLDQRTDLWSLAVIAFECLTGELPFRGESVGDIVVQICTSRPTLPSELAAVPAGFDEWFVKGTSKEPSGRFATARQMAEALSEILARSPAATARANGSQRDDVRAPPTLASVPAPRGVEAAPAVRAPVQSMKAPSERSGTRSVPVPPSQSTGPMTAPITPASPRGTPRPRASAKHRNVAVAAALAIACVFSAVVLCVFPPRRAGSVLEEATLAPANALSAPPVEVRASVGLGDSSGSAHEGREAAAASRGSPVPEPSRGLESEPALSLDAAGGEPGVASEEPSPVGVRRAAVSSRPGKHGAHGTRKHAAKAASGRPRRPSKKRSAEMPAASPNAAPETDPFSERQ